MEAAGFPQHEPTRGRAAASGRSTLVREGGLTVWLLIATCGVCDATFSSLAPFFPQHALDVGLSQASTGVVFSSFMWAGLVWVPVATRISRSTSPRALLSGCVLLQAALTALFAPTAALRSPARFFGATLAIRLVQGLVTTTYEVATTSMLMRSCAPERVGTWVGIQESARGIGLMVGPALGGLLFQRGGFALPFLASSGALAALGLLVLATLRAPGACKPAEGDAQPVHMLELLRRPGVCVPTCLLCALGAALSILDPTLAPHERRAFGLAPGAIGLTFTAPTLAYAALAPAAGALGARAGNFRTLVGGMCLTALSYLLLGPSPWLPALRASEALLVGALVVLGVGASTLTCCLPVMLDVAHAAGYETAQCSDVLGGAIALAWTAGALVGPLYGSAAVSALGFAEATSLTGAILLALTAVGAVVFAAVRTHGAPRAAAGSEDPFEYAAFPDPPAAGSARAPRAAGGALPLGCAVAELSAPLLERATSENGGSER
ncbi:hypothetical protein KFE25_012099 [Diacronema lutheri]|uniref:Major facilitator superfamily (MFS) profile domain-containing protein n=1 Tax=Diacronema lutheri TaxID=2081491 RepID=A0A8J6C6W5_DIALT|nr:hypothetical protein KFE25_012099 [Diacronema lutheri]